MNYYRRQGFLSDVPQVTRVLLIINIAVFVLDFLTRASGFPLKEFLALKSIHTGYFSPFQLVTHMFAHGDLFHIFFNMYFGLYMFGRFLESSIGSKKFFTLYFVSGFGAAGLQLLVYFLQGEGGYMIGASGAVMGIVAAFAVFYPNVELMLLFVPVPIKAKYLIPGFMVISLFLGVSNTGLMSNIAHMAHLGGAIVGAIVAWVWKQNQFKNRFTQY